jgi:hypothetical protein
MFSTLVCVIFTKVILCFIIFIVIIDIEIYINLKIVYLRSRKSFLIHIKYFGGMIDPDIISSTENRPHI